MKSLNQCQFIGNLGRGPEVRQIPNDKELCNFSIAVADDYTKDGQKVEQTEWVNCVAFGGLARICAEYLHKGSKVYVSGRMKTRSWEQDGVKRYATEVVLNDMIMLDSRTANAQEPQQSQPKQDSFEDLESVPF